MKHNMFFSFTSLLSLSSTVFCLRVPAYPSSEQVVIPKHSQHDPSKDLSDIIASSPLLTFHRALCEVKSVTFDELAVAELLISYLEAHNFSVTTQSVPQPESSASKKQRLNVIAFPKSSKSDTTSSSPKVLLSSHIDTVPPFIPYKLSSPSAAYFNRKDVLISGRGTVDAKACVATQIHAVLDLLSTSSISSSDVGLVFVVGEERAGDGMRAFSDSKFNQHAQYSAVIFGEPTEKKLATGHKGIVMVTIKAYGKAAHSGYPWLGRSANSMIIPALMVMDKLGDLKPEEGGLPRSDKFGNSTVNVGMMKGGVAANVIPEYAEAEVAMRLAGGTIGEVKGIVTNAVKSVNDDLEMEFSNGYGPVILDGDVEGFGEITVNYGTDVPNLRVKKGVKRYLYGPGSILVAHGKDEGLTVGDLEDAVEGYKKLVLHALGK